MGLTTFIFPGQGSQYVGMGKTLWETHDEVRRLYRDATIFSGTDIEGLSFEGPAHELDSDQAAQLAVFVCNEAHRISAELAGLSPSVVTGYSLGFYSALVAAGALGFRDGMDAVIAAGELAVDASSREPGTMGAVIGLSAVEVEALCEEARTKALVWVSNVNAARQVLVSGSVVGVDRAVGLANERGALKAYRLAMGAAYHSPMMEDAARRFSRHASLMRIKTPLVPVVSYLDAEYIMDAEGLRHTVGSQIARRVLWKDTVQRLIADGTDVFVEVGPGSALSRMVRWVDRSVKARSLDETDPAAADAAKSRREEGC